MTEDYHPLPPQKKKQSPKMWVNLTISRHTLWLFNSLLLNIAIEIVSFPIKSGDLNHSYVNVYQRANSTRIR